MGKEWRDKKSFDPEHKNVHSGINHEWNRQDSRKFERHSEWKQPVQNERAEAGKAEHLKPLGADQKSGDWRQSAKPDFRIKDAFNDRSRLSGADRAGLRHSDTDNSGFRKKQIAPAVSPRRIALDTLLDVSLKNAYAQLALEKRLRQVQLDARDTGFVTRLVYGTIERRITLDYRLDLVLEKPDELDPTVREILRMAAYQLFYMDRVPDMAATDEAVQLTRNMGMEGLTGLVNGVLRNLIREKEHVEWPAPENDPVRYLSVMYSAPEVLCRMLIERFGEHEALEILRFHQKKPYESIRPNLLRCDDARLRRLLADDVFSFEPGLVDGTYRVYDAGDLTRLRAYQNGLFVIQGESSVLAARAVGARPGQTVLDACAAPGGKTSLISEMMQDTGRVYAWDTHPHRVDLIRGMAKRLKLENVRPIIRDAQEQRPEMAGTLDAAIIDAPCSGSGVMDIKPDLKYRITPEGVESLVHVQSSILDGVSEMVKPGGTLVYSTCSIFPEENEQQISAFLERHPEYSINPLGNLLPASLQSLESSHGIQLFAHRDNLDGFYICRMKKS
ncbi:MAG: 16S rRNA (cytosine(967)-C(5))-methyltransferase RsmB [Clostridia bacterium]|nr:16S rRNA (cytosine(967)-C(5))-methyltransferase RsmB [Clostridia bacterium]